MKCPSLNLSGFLLFFRLPAPAGSSSGPVSTNQPLSRPPDARCASSEESGASGRRQWRCGRRSEPDRGTGGSAACEEAARGAFFGPSGTCRDLAPWRPRGPLWGGTRPASPVATPRRPLTRLSLAARCGPGASRNRGRRHVCPTYRHGRPRSSLTGRSGARGWTRTPADPPAGSASLASSEVNCDGPRCPERSVGPRPAAAAHSGVEEPAPGAGSARPAPSGSGTAVPDEPP